MSRSWRERQVTKKMMSEVPWLKRLKTGVPCDGIKYSQMSMKALRTLRLTGNEDLYEKYRCKNLAYWKFAALETVEFPATSGTYCWQHLMYSAIFHNSHEEARFNRWYKKWLEKHEV